MNRRFKDFAKNAVAFGHRTALRAGIVVLPNHYYTPVADANQLRRTRSTWARRSPMIGIDVDVSDQSALLRSTVKPFEPEFRGNKPFLEGSSKEFGPGFGYIEAQCLHGVLRTFKPRKIIEVGSGVSTYCALHACGLNAQDGNTAQITCIEPNPRAFLRTANNRGISLIESPVQSIDPAFFLGLDAGDLLFIDSTHAVKPGGDVLYLYLEVLPRLNPGVLIHIHDIFFPYLYQPDVLNTLYQWSETALLQALLTRNAHLSVLFCLSQLHYDAPEVLTDVFPEYVPRSDDRGLVRPGMSGHFPSSIYLRTA